MATFQTVVELPESQRRGKAIMSDDERVSLISYIAAIQGIAQDPYPA